MEALSTVEGTFSISWKRYILPSIHPEGWKIILPLFLLFLVVGGICYFAFSSQVSKCVGIFFWGVSIPVLIFSIYFFRNPPRVTPDCPNTLFAPADGIVCSVKKMVPPETLQIGQEERIRVSIFMSVFNVHVNRIPCSGKIVALKYHKGKFVNAADKESDENERQELSIECPDGTRIGVVQIAGLVARRIYCPLIIGQELRAGEVFGLIRFGSRLDVYLPPGVLPKVMLGQTMIAGETPLAVLDDHLNEDKTRE